MAWLVSLRPAVFVGIPLLLVIHPRFAAAVPSLPLVAGSAHFLGTIDESTHQYVPPTHVETRS
jgi:hypothetical protein